VIGAQNERGPGISVRHGELSAAETVDALPHRDGDREILGGNSAFAHTVDYAAVSAR
jgi:hypothetical protein